MKKFNFRALLFGFLERLDAMIKIILHRQLFHNRLVERLVYHTRQKRDLQSFLGNISLADFRIQLDSIHPDSWISRHPNGSSNRDDATSNLRSFL